MRPSKYNDKIHKAIVKNIRDHIPIELTADLVSIRHTTLQNWLNEGEDDIEKGIDSNLARLFRDVKKAHAEAAQEGVVSIKRAGKTDKHWTAWAWILERQYRKHFSAAADLQNQIDLLSQSVRELLKLRNGEQSNGREMDSGSDQEKGKS